MIRSSSILRLLCLLTGGAGAVALAASPPSAVIEVTSASSIRSIPSTLFGTNLEWIWNGDLVWSGNAVDPRYAALINQAGPTLFRFPGGLFSDYYNWQNGVGPQSSRPVSVSMPGGAVSANTFGTDEALQLAKSANGQLLITVNAGTGTPQMAAAWVQYINKSGKGTRVDYWEIGNELYIPASTIGSVGIATMSASQYASTVVAFAEAMKAVDPTIKVGAILDESLNTQESSPWTTTVLTEAGASIDFVAVHNAYAPTLSGSQNYDVHSVYEAMLAAPSMVAADLASLPGRIDALVPSRAGQISIAVTEWGAFYQFDPASPYIDHVKTLGSALYTASTLMEFIRSQRTVIANQFKLSDPLVMGMIGLKNNVPAATAPLYAMQLFTQHTGPLLIPSSVTSPVFSTPGAGSIGPAANVPYLDAIATLSADKKHCFITAVNRDLDAAMPVSIQLGPLTPGGSATAWILRGTAIDANTGTNPPAGYLQAPQAVWAAFNNGGPNQVTLSSTSLAGIKSSFDYVIPAATAVSIDIPLKVTLGPGRY